MRVTIHQPEFLPWLGFFHKVSLADQLILLDDVQFRKNYFQNRNRILAGGKPAWLTIPVKRAGLSTNINEIQIASDTNKHWKHKIETSVRQSYGRSPYFDSIFNSFSKLLEQSNDLLVSLNIPLIQWMLDEFGLANETVLSSTFNLDSTGSHRILDICCAIGATTYISGISGKDYLDLEEFEKSGISVEFQEFHHPIYEQLVPNFTPLISALESLFLFGPSASKLLKPDWPKRMETLFT